MMKPRTTSRAVINEQAMSGRNKSESITNAPAAQTRNQVQLANAQASAQAIRKRRSSINVYDQPSSLNSRLRQLETDMLRLDEDRTKLFDDTHSALAQYELRLNEIHAILKSRQDNVDKYVEDMKLLLQAKEDFENQAKMLHEKHDRVHEKFMHRETTISREIKLLKNKFELLEKNRQFRSILQKSGGTSDDNLTDDLASGFDVPSGGRIRSETISEADSMQLQDNRLGQNVKTSPGFSQVRKQLRKKSNRISSIVESAAAATTAAEGEPSEQPEANGGGGGGSNPIISGTNTIATKTNKRRANMLSRFLFGKEAN